MDRDAAIEARYLKGYSLRRLGQIHGLSQEGVRQILKRRGVALRDRRAGRTPARFRAAARKAVATMRVRYPHRFMPNPDDRLQHLAHRCVKFAIEAGRLPKLDGSVKCVDCVNPASVYDHRDYWRPFDVDPVCKGCNTRRGSVNHALKVAA